MLLVRNGTCFALGSLIWLIAFNAFTWRRALAASMFYFGALLEVAITAWPGNRGSPVPPAFLFSVSVAVMMMAVDSRRWLGTMDLGRWNAVVRAAGLATYPLYLIHNVTGAILLRRLVNSGMSDTTALLAALALIFVIVGVVVTILERQIGRILSKLLPIPTQLRFAAEPKDTARSRSKGFEP